jgi:hypothetical protein
MLHAWKTREVHLEVSSRAYYGKRPLGRSRRIWENNIKKDLQEMGAE